MLWRPASHNRGGRPQQTTGRGERLILDESSCEAKIKEFPGRQGDLWAQAGHRLGGPRVPGHSSLGGIVG